MIHIKVNKKMLDNIIELCVSHVSFGENILCKKFEEDEIL